MSEAIVVFLTAADANEARRIAGRLIEARLAACVQILPEMESVYRWKNEVKHDKEVLLLAKTTTARFAELEREIRGMHSYETPEILAVPAASISSPYSAWLSESVARDS